MEARAVVINVGTDMFSKVAAASVLARTDLPVTLVDCGDTLAEQRFADLEERWSTRLEIAAAPARPHGVTLDNVFATASTDIVVCVDSDAELISDTLVPKMLAAFEEDSVFGAGFTNGPQWLSEREGVGDRIAYFQERPWMPFVAFRASHVRRALAAGKSFSNRNWWNDFPASQRVGHHAAKRFQDALAPHSDFVARLPRPLRSRLRNSRLDWLAWIRRDFNGHRPNYVVWDTGADLYQWCKHQQGLLFAGDDCAFATNAVRHAFGVTRRALDPAAVNTGEASTEDQLEGRLVGYLQARP